MIPRYGYVAAAYTTLVSYLLLMLFHYIAVTYVIKEKVYANAYMFIAMGVSMAAGIAMCLFYGDGTGMIIKRYCVAAVTLTLFALINRKDVMLLADYLKKRLNLTKI